MQPQPFPLCPCADCMAQWLEWSELTHDMDNLAAHDTLTAEQWRAEFASWVGSDPERSGA